MKKLIIITIVIILALCVKLAYDDRELKRLPETSAGLTYKVTEDRFERGLGRYEIRIEVNQEPTEKDVKSIGEWIDRTHTESNVFIIFFNIKGHQGARVRLDLPSGMMQFMQDEF